MQIVHKGFLILIALFLLFFVINYFISFNSDHKSAYKVLTSNGEKNEKSKIMLQDTRVHNWSELQKIQKKK